MLYVKFKDWGGRYYCSVTYSNCCSFNAVSPWANWMSNRRPTT